MSEFFFLDKIPMPPSLNQLYANKSKFARCKSQAYIQFENRFKFFTYKNHKSIEELKIKLNEKIKDGFLIEITHTFYFDYKSIFTKDHRPKRNDTSNRPKALDDCLAKTLEIDDSYFFDVLCKKRINEDNSFEYAQTEFRFFKITK
jgi:hypothetical protein